MKLTPCQIDQAIADLMKTGMTGESYKVALVALQAARKHAEKRFK